LKFQLNRIKSLWPGTQNVRLIHGYFVSEIKVKRVFKSFKTWILTASSTFLKCSSQVAPLFTQASIIHHKYVIRRSPWVAGKPSYCWRKIRARWPWVVWNRYSRMFWVSSYDFWILSSHLNLCGVDSNFLGKKHF